MTRRDVMLSPVRDDLTYRSVDLALGWKRLHETRSSAEVRRERRRAGWAGRADSGRSHAWGIVVSAPASAEVSSVTEWVRAGLTFLCVLALGSLLVLVAGR